MIALNQTCKFGTLGAGSEMYLSLIRSQSGQTSGWNVEFIMHSQIGWKIAQTTTQGFYPLLRNVCAHVNPLHGASVRSCVCPEKQHKSIGFLCCILSTGCSYSPAHLLSIWKHPDVGSDAVPVYFLQGTSTVPAVLFVEPTSTPSVL